jgi:hypothetical protein
VGWFDDGKRWRGVDFAVLVPERRAASEPGGDPGRVVLLQPRYQGWLLGRLLQPRLPAHKKYLRVPLEERGSFLWALVDGRRTVADLVAAFEAEFPDERAQAGERVAGYLYHLAAHGFLGFANLETT